MAGRLILLKNMQKTINGDCEAVGYEKQLKLESLAFSTLARSQSDSGSGTVHQSSMVIDVPFGPWIGELQQRLFHSEMLGDVEIVEIEQKVVDGKKEWKKIREVHLQDGWIAAMSHSWSDIHGSFQVTLEYTDMTFAVGDKIAHYNRSEKT